VTAPLSEIIGRSVALQRRSASGFVGLCPFHFERTPSFTVDDAKGAFHCFGCRAHGDAADFEMKLVEKGGRQ
jgi:DNA primase